MIPRELKKWSILSLLEPKFVATIRMVLVYGNSGDECLIVTKDEEVYSLGKSTNLHFLTDGDQSLLHPRKVNGLCHKNIKTISHFSGPFVFVLLHDGKVVSLGHQFPKKNWYFNVNDTVSKVVRSKLNGKFIVNIVCGSNHGLALTDTGEVALYSHRTILSELDNERVVDISCGHMFSIVVTDSGNVYGWEVIIETQTFAYKVGGLKGIVIVKVACGYDHVLALSNEGDVYVWGGNRYGQLGLGNRNETDTAVLLKGTKMGRVLDIAASFRNYMSVAVGEYNDIFVWGECLGQAILTPLLTSLKNVHDAFACYATIKVMHKQLILTDVEEERGLMDYLKEAFDNPAISDFTIQVEGQPIYVHKAMLKIRSPYFRAMFQDHWMENNKREIECSEFSYKVYRNFLKYLYTDEIDLPAGENAYVLELLRLADVYFDIRLKKRCTHIIKECITVYNVATLYSDAVRFNAMELQEYCLKYALDHMAAVIGNSGNTELKEATMKMFLTNASEASTSKK